MAIDPSDLLPKCLFCRETVLPGGPDCWPEVRGFSPPPRKAGGQNAVFDRRETGRFACDRCVRMRKKGMSPDQGAMM